jgi:Tyrosyl-DNA phosphodiesterase
MHLIPQQSQGAWWQDFPLKQDNDTSHCAGTNTQFGPALIDYLRCTAGLRHSSDTNTIAAMPTAAKLANLAPAAANLIHLTERLEHNYDLSTASVILTARLVYDKSMLKFEYISMAVSVYGIQHSYSMMYGRVAVYAMHRNAVNFVQPMYCIIRHCELITHVYDAVSKLTQLTVLCMMCYCCTVYYNNSMPGPAMNYCHPIETRQKFGQCQIRHILQNEPELTAFQRPMRARSSTSSSSNSSSGKANSSSDSKATTNSSSSSSSSSSSKKKLTPAQHYAKDLSMASALSSVWTYNRDLCGNLTGPVVPDESAVQSTTATSSSNSSGSSSSSTSASGKAAAARAAAAAAGISTTTAAPTKASTTTAAAVTESVYTGSKLLCQCSSIGSLKAGWLNTFYDNFTVKAGTSSGAAASTSKSTDALDMQIVWPTAASIRGSLRGWSSGGSIPCQPTSMFEVRTSCNVHFATVLHCHMHTVQVLSTIV